MTVIPHDIIGILLCPLVVIIILLLAFRNIARLGSGFQREGACSVRWMAGAQSLPAPRVARTATSAAKSATCSPGISLRRRLLLLLLLYSGNELTEQRLEQKCVCMRCNICVRVKLPRRWWPVGKTPADTEQVGNERYHAAKYFCSDFLDDEGEAGHCPFVAFR